jgi:hypothetical protein
MLRPCDLPGYEQLRPLRTVVCFCALVLAFGPLPIASAQKVDRRDIKPMLFPDRGGYGAGTLVSAGMNPITGPVDQLAVLLAGQAASEPFWILRDTTIIQPLDPADLAKVIDDAPLPRAVGEPTPDQLAELRAYVNAVVYASLTPNQTLNRLARRGLSFGDLYVDVASLRGQVVHVDARLMRLQEVPAPPEVIYETGLTHLYEAWVATDAAKSDLVCVLFTELPPGLKPGEHLDLRVECSGYYLKRLGYTPRKGAPDTVPGLAPLIIAHTLTVLPRPAAEENPLAWVNGVLPLMVGFLFGVVSFIVVLAVWFRRVDARIRRRLQVARRREFVPPTPEVVPLALPVNQPVNRIAAFDRGNDPNDPARTT